MLEDLLDNTHLIQINKSKVFKTNKSNKIENIKQIFVDYKFKLGKTLLTKNKTHTTIFI